MQLEGTYQDDLVHLLALHSTPQESHHVLKALFKCFLNISCTLMARHKVELRSINKPNLLSVAPLVLPKISASTPYSLQWQSYQEPSGEVPLNT